MYIFITFSDDINLNPKLHFLFLLMGYRIKFKIHEGEETLIKVAARLIQKLERIGGTPLSNLRIPSPKNNLSTSVKWIPAAVALPFPEEKITITSATSLISVYRAPRRERYVMANTVIPHSSREHRER